MNAFDYVFNLGYWSIEGFWLPLLVWSVPALPITILLLYGRRGAVSVRYALAMALLAALPIGLLAAGLLPDSADSVSPLGIIYLPALVVEPGVFADPSTAWHWTTVHSAGVLFIVAVLTALRRMSLLMVEFIRLFSLQRVVSNSIDVHVQSLAASLANHLEIRRPVRVSLSSTARTPMTFGWRRPVVILPANLTNTPRDLRLALIHELIHVRRDDYVLQWIEQIVGAVFVIHPLVAVLRHEASLLRESSCDADLVTLFGDQTRYARLLYRFSTKDGSPWSVAVGISLRKNHLRRRITAMKDAKNSTRHPYAKRIGLTLAVLTFGLSAIVVACSDNFVSDDASPDATATDGALEADSLRDDVYVIVEEMPQIVGGLQSIQNNLSYPQLAARAGIEGRVIVQFVVDEEGAVENPTVIRSVGSGLDAAALKAVEAATFTPGKQNGESVKVKMSLPVTFKLPRNEENGGSDDRQYLDGQRDSDVTMPELIGGLESIQKRLRYPETAHQAGVEGRVIIQLTLDKAGFVAHAEVVRGVGYGLDEEALRVARLARFTPGAINGEPTETKLSLPISFKLANSSGVPVGTSGREVEATSDSSRPQ